jgi:hypothetical protein
MTPTFTIYFPQNWVWSRCMDMLWPNRKCQWFILPLQNRWRAEVYL